MYKLLNPNSEFPKLEIDIHDIEKGDFVKVLFVDTEDADIEPERMWVEVKKIDYENGFINGKLANIPYWLKNVKYGDIIEFDASQIIKFMYGTVHAKRINHAFYILSANNNNNFVGLESELLNEYYAKTGVNLTFYLNQATKNSELRFPMLYIQCIGEIWGDVLSIKLGNSGLIISEKFKTFLEKNFITGWLTYPVNVFDKNEDEVEGYYGFSIVGRAKGPVYKKESIVTMTNPIDGLKNEVYLGFDIIESSWDGMDIFLLESKMKGLTGKAFVISERFYKLLVEYGYHMTTLELYNINDSSKPIKDINEKFDRVVSDDKYKILSKLRKYFEK